MTKIQSKDKGTARKKRLKAQEERKFKKEEKEKKQVGKNIAKIFRFAAQLIIAALLFLVIIYVIF